MDARRARWIICAQFPEIAPADVSYRRRFASKQRVAIFAAGVVGALLFSTAPVGEGDRSQSAAIGMLRAIASAQASYRTVTGEYAPLECLAGASSCPAGVAGVFLAPDIAARRERQGYRFEVFVAPGGHSQSLEPGGPRKMTRFAAIARPISSATASRPSFCVDASGIIHVTEGAEWPRVDAATCSDTTRPVNSPRR